MWEKVRVGKKKLKANATPTNFPSKNSTNIPAIERNEHVDCINFNCILNSVIKKLILKLSIFIDSREIHNSIHP